MLFDVVNRDTINAFFCAPVGMAVKWQRERITACLLPFKELKTIEILQM